MTTPTIESQDLTIAGVLQSFYVVPDYQREYVWETDQVEQLLGDIFGELGTRYAGSAPEYFIGSIVVCPGDGGVLELIDGQQRMDLANLARRTWDVSGTAFGAGLPNAAACPTEMVKQ